MRKKIKSTTYSLIFSLLVGLFYGQSIELPKNIQSPNAASLGKYGDVPVNLYTGKANVNIPIYSLEERGIKLNLSLNYDTGGIRINEAPSWIGQNWSLNAGGVITRSVKGLFNDEYLNEEGGEKDLGYNKLGVCGYMYNYQRLDNINWSSTNRTNLENLLYWPRDLEPDIFTFNFMGKTGKFFLGHDGKWKVQSEDNLKIIINKEDFVYPLNSSGDPSLNNGYPIPKTIGKITIIDENGLQYEFGSDTESIEYSIDFFDQKNHHLIANSWYLTKIKDPNNNLLYSFEYRRGEVIPHFYLENSYRKFNLNSNFTLFGGCAKDCSEEPGQGTLSTPGMLIFPTYLNKILTQSGTSIEFEKSPSYNLNFTYKDNPSLDYYFNQLLLNYSFNINGITPFIKYNLFYVTHYFDTNNSWRLSPEFIIWLTLDNYKERIFNRFRWYKLDNIIVKSGNNEIENITLVHNSNNKDERLNLLKVFGEKEKKLYTLEYNNFGNLPSLLSRGLDHWGYYKGTDMKMYYSPGMGKDFQSHYASREPVEEFLQVGLLKKIIYPTNGYSEFIFEPNYYKKYVGFDGNNNFTLFNTNTNEMAGGVRIKSIIANDNNGNTIEKKYQYTVDKNSNESSGVLGIKNTYYWPEWKTNTYDKPGSYTETIFSINNIIPLGNFSGSHIAYSKVFEITENKGYIENVFSDFSDHPDENYLSTLCPDRSIFDSHINNDFLRGKLKKQIIYNNNSKIFEKEIAYAKYNNNFLARAVGFKRYSICPEVSQNCIDMNNYQYGNSYTIPFYDYKVSNIKEKNYFNGNFVETNTSFEYIYESSNNDYILTDKIVTNKEIVNDLNAYEKLYTYANGQNNQYLISKNMIGIPLETEVKKNEITISKTNTNYPSSEAEANIKTSGLPLPYEVLKKDLQSTTMHKDVTYDKYDSKGNLLQYSIKGVNPVTIIWGYNDTYPIAIIKGIKYDDVKTNSLIKSIITLSNKDINQAPNSDELALLTEFANLRKDSLFSSLQITSYTYDPLIGVRSITPPSGITEFYHYDFSNRLKSIVDVNDNIIKEYQYNYNMPFLNTMKTGKFMRNNCSNGYQGGDYTYTVLPGIYSSSISQEDADQQAQSDIDINGQKKANENALCSQLFYNISLSEKFIRNNCPSSYGGDSYIYTIPEKKYSSLISQVDANQKAQNEININGQNNANLYGSCIPMSSFTFASSFGAPYTMANTIYSTSDNVVKVYLAFQAYGLNKSSWPYGVNMGNVGSCCTPSKYTEFVYEENNRTWKIKIDTTGNCSLILLSGAVDTTSYGIPLIFKFQYQK